MIVALRTGVVTARSTRDGSEIWSAALAATGEIEAGGAVVLVPTEGVVQALDLETGRRRWQHETAALTAPPLARGGWVILAAAERVTALRESDGAEIWTKQVPSIEAGKTAVIDQQPAVDGRVVFVPVSDRAPDGEEPPDRGPDDGRLLALDLLSGSIVWEAQVGPDPTAPFVYADRVYFGSAGRLFWCLRAGDGTESWRALLGATVRGRAAADERGIYVAAMDNLLRGYDRGDGALEWKEDLKHRPSAGPLVVGSAVAVPGPVQTFRIFDTRSHRSSDQLTLPDPAVTPPAVSPAGPALLAIVTNELGRPWLLTLAGPAPPKLPALVPLSAPPSPALPLPALPGG